MRINLDDQESIEPNMAPLLDCIFLLLIFFLVATSFEQQQREEQEIKTLQITLPSSAVALESGKEGNNELVISLDRRGRFYIDGQRVSTNALHGRLKQQAVLNPNRTIRIDGDRDTPLQHVVHLMDLLEFEGLTHIRVRAASDAYY